MQSSQRSFDEYQLLELERRLRKERLKANLAVLDKYILYYQVSDSSVNATLFADLHFRQNSKLRQNNSALQASQESLSHSLLTNMRSNSSLFDTVSSQTSHLRDLSRLISENDLALHALLSENKTQAVALSQAQSRIADLAAENMRAKSLIKTLQKEVDRTRHNSDHSSAGTFKRYSRS